jgi:hypothetical protein
MKNFLIVFFAINICLFSGCTQSSNKKTEEKDQVGNLPEITFEAIEHDYGTIEYNGNGEYEFVFENTGDSPLVLKNVKTSCGCTASEWSKEPIKEGENGKIKVSYRTNIPGSFNKSITVYSNASNAVVTLRIKGNVEKNIVAAEAT